MSQLTDTQLKSLKFIADQTIHQRPCPSLREIAQYMGYAAVGSVQDILRSLQKKGFISRRKRGSARTLQLTTRAWEYLQLEDPALQSRNSSRFGGGFLRESLNFLRIPKLGQVPAGSPAEAIEMEADADVLVVSPDLLNVRSQRFQSLFALKTAGWSMKDAGILDGDWLVVEKVEEANAGEIVIAKTSDNEATCKRLMFDGKKGWFLKPENEEFQNIWGKTDPFHVIGKVVGLQRTL